MQMIVACHHWTGPPIQKGGQILSWTVVSQAYRTLYIPSARRNTGLSDGIARRAFGEASTINQEEVLRPISLS